MRTIKFRAWDEINNEMVYEKFGSFFGNYLPSHEILRRYENAMQFTGLHDKNGKEIFEGDKLRDDYSDEETVIEDYAVVVWDGKLCQWAIDNSFAKDGSSFTNMVEYFGRENLEVIGNIHEDSCLLE